MDGVWDISTREGGVKVDSYLGFWLKQLGELNC